jgi:hypothetical protein
VAVGEAVMRSLHPLEERCDVVDSFSTLSLAMSAIQA